MTAPSPHAVRSALLLTNRLVPVGAAPLTAREFWGLADRVDVAELVDMSADDIASRVSVVPDDARRIRTLLDATTAFAFEQDRLLDGGIVVLSALDQRFPAGLRDRLGPACPPFLLVAGPIEWLAEPGLAVVGSLDAEPRALDVARRSALLAVERGWPVISGLARGVDQAATSAASDAGGRVVGVPAEGIARVSRHAAVRAQVHAGELCIASPYAPDAPSSAGNAIGRDTIVDALSRTTFVVSSSRGSGRSWAAMTAALDRGLTPVAVWAGDGATDGNRALIERGARPIADLAALFVEPAVTPCQTSLFDT